MKTANDRTTLVAQRIHDCSTLMEALLRDSVFQQALADASDALIEVLRGRHKVLFFGNGGSAADAQHLAAELAGRFQFDRPALAGLALTVNTSCLTAIGNDYEFDQIFSRQVESLGVPGDAAVGITTSGRSSNVLRALQTARGRGMVTVSLTGRDSDALRDLTDFCISIPSKDTARIQEAHILTGHILCEIIEKGIFGEASRIS